MFRSSQAKLFLALLVAACSPSTPTVTADGEADGSGDGVGDVSPADGRGDAGSSELSDGWHPEGVEAGGDGDGGTGECGPGTAECPGGCQGDCGPADCAADTGDCVGDVGPELPDGVCVPDCKGKECGDNGCGTQCGLCDEGTECVAGVCACVPQCQGKSCGPDACGGECGTCGDEKVCNAAGVCVCEPDCVDKECGSDGCGGMCGFCTPGDWCIDFLCTSSCVQDCQTPGEKSCLAGGWRECGQFDDDTCLDWGPVVECDPGLTCVGGSCVCVPECKDKECGPDGCGSECGACDGTPCIAGKCSCAGDCTNRECGWDGCTGSCGACAGSEVCNGDGACVAPAKEGQYLVGVDYHAVTVDFNNASFLSQYHVPAVRTQVLKQIEAMAEAGADILSVRLWLVDDMGKTPDKSWKWNFPPSESQLKNLQLFVMDVSEMKKPDGSHIELYLGTLYLWCADYTVGTPDTTLGECGLTGAEFADRVSQTYDLLLQALAGLYRSDGLPAVTRIYVDGEVMTAASDADPAAQWEKKNQRWFLQTVWPVAAAKIAARGMIPSIYFITAPTEDEALDNGFADDYLPELTGHRSVFWIYRSLKFLKDHALPVPNRVEFSLYPVPPCDTYGAPAVVNRVFDDLEAVATPLLGAGFRYGVAETYYPASADRRMELGRAFASERKLRGNNPETITFWTTPYNDGSETPSVGPFDFSVFSLSGITEPFAATNASFELDDDASGRPDGWETAWANGPLAAWFVTRYVNPADAFEGSAALRIQSGACADCPGDFDGVWVASDPVPAVPGDVVVARFEQRNAVYPLGQEPWTGAWSGPVAALVATKQDGTETAFRVRGFPYGQWKYRRHVLVGQAPAGTVSVSLRFGLQKAFSQDLDIDWLH